jgi:hypothetical protein
MRNKFTESGKILGVFVSLLVVGVLAMGATQRGVYWTELHGPAASTQATISHAAVAGKQHIAECIVATFAAGASAPTAVTVNVYLRDGASGSGAIRYSAAMSLPAVAGQSAAPLQLCGLNIAGTAGSAMTLEFSGSGGSNTTESVFLQGRTE